MNINKFMINLLLLFLLVNIVSAQEDFSATSLPSVELCPCSNQAYTVTVENTGSDASSYTLAAGGDSAEWITFNPDRFVLDPGQSGSFFVFVNSVCNIEGSSDLEIFITTGNGLTKVVEQTLVFSQCYDYSLQQGRVVDFVEDNVDYLQHDGAYNLCVNEQSSIPILITNNEEYENQYRLLLDAPEWVALNVNNVNLGAEQSGIFLISSDTTDIEGNFDFKLTVISALGEVQRKNSFEVNVGECYALEVNLEKEEDVVCGGEEISYDVEIKNLGTLGYDVNLEVDGPAWASLESGTLHIDSDEEENVVLNVDPSSELSGSFVLTVHAVPDDRTEFRFSDSINVEIVENLACFQASINTKSSVTNLYEEDFFFVRVTNEGIKETTYSVSLEGPSWVEVSPESLKLNPGQTGNLNLNIDPAEDIVADTYEIKILLETGDALYSKNVDIKLKKESELIKTLKSTFKFYQYYIYLLIALVVLIIIFIKPIIKVKNNIGKRHERYKIKKERLEALKEAKEQREEERQKKKEHEEINKETERKKDLEKEETVKGKKERKSKDFFKKYKAWIYSLIALVILIVIGQYLKLYNLKYTPIYLRNIFYGYLYYILIGVGTVIILFGLVLLYNFFSKRKKKVKNEVVKEEKVREERWYDKPSYVIAILVPIIIIIAALAYFNLFDDVKDFFVLYLSYFIIGILILVILIVFLRLYKKISKFLKS